MNPIILIAARTAMVLITLAIAAAMLAGAAPVAFAALLALLGVTFVIAARAANGSN